VDTSFRETSSVITSRQFLKDSGYDLNEQFLTIKEPHFFMLKYILIIAILLYPFSAIHASEGGSSGYLQGSYGDFASGMIGPSGFYMRNDLFFADTSIGVRTLGGGD